MLLNTSFDDELLFLGVEMQCVSLFDEGKKVPKSLSEDRIV